MKGKLEPTEIYEVIGEQGEIDEAHLASARLYEEGLEAYFGQRFAAAIDCFAQAIEADPQDEAASVMRQRCEAYLESPPPANWDGVHIMKTK